MIFDTALLCAAYSCALQAAEQGLTDGDILAQQSGPDFELFIKSGLSPFNIQLTPAAWEIVHAETASGQQPDALAAAAAVAAAAATAAGSGAVPQLADAAAAGGVESAPAEQGQALGSA
jgi:hypothetical protein